MTEYSDRALLSGSAVGLLLLGLFFTTLLVADYSDNAYSYLAFIGWGLIAAAVPFAVGALVPPGRLRRLLTRTALGVIVLVGVLGLALLVLSILVIPSQSYESDRVFISHAVGLLALLGALWALKALYRGRVGSGNREAL
jgi:Kef-type K+ transport system membrane component KefB